MFHQESSGFSLALFLFCKVSERGAISMSNQTASETLDTKAKDKTEDKIEDSRLETLFQEVSAEYGQTTPEERTFLKTVKNYIKVSVHSRNKNKPAYFSGNQQAGQNEQVRTFLNEQKNNFFMMIIYIVTGIFALFAGITSSQKIVSVIAPFLFVAWVLFSVWITMRSEKKRRELLLKRYGETWVRHSCTVAYYEEEMVRFLCRIAPYDQSDDALRKKLFQERFMAVAHDNIERFRENMKPPPQNERKGSV